MYFTFYTNLNKKIRNDNNTLFFQLLKNPTILIPTNNYYNKTKITIKLEETYAKNYFEKHPFTIYDHKPFLRTPLEEITKHYYSFTIPKKSNPNKHRKIDAPDILLKTDQTNIKNFFEYNLKILPHEAAHAYVKDRSTITALKKHQQNNSKWFLKLDLKDFFPSHNKKFILDMLKQIYPFAILTEEDFSTIEYYIDYALLNDSLPQGTPLSPMLTNITMVPIDTEITNTLKNFKKHSFMYTRYADDILISCKYNFKPGPVITQINHIFKQFNAPFKINKEKTRYGSSAGRNWNLGIMLNKDNNLTIGHKNNQIFRAKLYDYICNKEQWSKESIQEFMGLISYYKNIEPDYINYQINKYNHKYNLNILDDMKKRIAY